jgi:Domain of Unknown Function with PDB structure (DUF3857)/Transglutaminase-like superfamily
MSRRLIRLAAISLLAGAAPVWAKSPDWLRELATAPLPPQAPEVEAVQLLNQVELVVTPDGKMRKRVRGAIRMLRREGQRRARLELPQSIWSKVQEMHGWTIPARDKDGKAGKELEVSSKDAIEVSATNVQGGELISDVRIKLLQIPNPEPGATVGFEYEMSLNPLEMADTFNFQQTIPILEATYTLKLPPGWNMQPTWVNHATIESVSAGAQQWRWTLKDIPAVQIEAGMPAWESVAGHLFLAVSAPGKAPQLGTWAGIGSWFLDLARDRRVASSDIRSSVAGLVAGKTSELEKMRALGAFVQREVRYVAITLGIGGYQPHAASDVFVNRYGDCKDKATLLAVMLSEAGIDSVPVIVNAQRSEVRTDTPPRVSAFNHVIVAIRLPRDLQHPSLLATVEHEGARWLIFDPTDELTPFGRIRGELQGNVGLPAFPDSSRLITLPQLQPGHAGTRRTARLTLDEQGLLAGDVTERITGQDALMQRGFLRSANRDSDTTKIVEARLAGSLASFQLTGAATRNREASELPLEWDYRISAPSYARRSGDLLMVRPRVIGVEATNLPGEGKPRVHDLLLVEPKLSQDEFVIDLPAGYVVESLPQPVEVNTGFAVYRSRTEVTGSQLKYTRSYEVRELTVPAARIGDFRRLQSEIARDERAVVVLKKGGTGM